MLGIIMFNFWKMQMQGVIRQIFVKYWHFGLVADPTYNPQVCAVAPQGLF